MNITFNDKTLLSELYSIGLLPTRTYSGLLNLYGGKIVSVTVGDLKQSIMSGDLARTKNVGAVTIKSLCALFKIKEPDYISKNKNSRARAKAVIVAFGIKESLAEDIVTDLADAKLLIGWQIPRSRL